MIRILVLIALFFISGCAEMPLKDGELKVGKNATATIEDMGVAKIKNQF